MSCEGTSENPQGLRREILIADPGHLNLRMGKGWLWRKGSASCSGVFQCDHGPGEGDHSLGSPLTGNVIAQIAMVETYNIPADADAHAITFHQRGGQFFAFVEGLQCLGVHGFPGVPDTDLILVGVEPYTAAGLVGVGGQIEQKTF